MAETLLPTPSRRVAHDQRQAVVLLVTDEPRLAEEEGLKVAVARVGMDFRVMTPDAVTAGSGSVPEADIMVLDGKLDRQRFERSLEVLIQSSASRRVVVYGGLDDPELETLIEPLVFEFWPRPATSPTTATEQLAQRLELLGWRCEATAWRERYRVLHDTLPVGLYTVDADGVILTANTTLARLLGYRDPDMLEGEQIFEYAANRERVKPLQRSRTGHRPFWGREVCLRRRDGGRVWGVLTDRRVGSGDDAVYEGSFLESGQNRKVQAQLARGEALYVELFSAMTEPTLLLSDEGQILACNKPCETLLGRSAVELVGGPFTGLVDRMVAADGELLEEHALSLETLAAAGSRTDGAFVGVRRQDRSRRWVTLVIRAISGNRHDEDSHFLVSMIDHTELRELALEAHRARIDSALSRGIAHDTRNLLAAIRGASSLMLHPEADTDAIRGYADQIDRAAASAGLLLASLSRYSGSKRDAPDLFEVDELLSSVTRLVAAAVSDRADLRLDLNAAGVALIGDSMEFERAIFNLVVNAREAIGELRGRIDVRSEVQEGVPASMAKKSNGVERWVRIVVRDNGCGMSDEVRERAFEPLFSSKNSDSGRGLGLVNVARFVDEVGGGIEVESAVGVGTQISLLLPAAPIV